MVQRQTKQEKGGKRGSKSLRLPNLFLISTEMRSHVKATLVGLECTVSTLEFV